MATIRPLKALRPPRAKAAQVSAVPYDVVSTAEARELAAGNLWSFLHVSRAEIDLPDATDPYSDTVYRKAAENFERLKCDCPLSAEEVPSLYVYRLRMGNHEQTGVAACCSVDEYDTDTIRKHERTRRDKEDDRTKHILTLRAQTGPVFLTYRDRPEIDQIVARTTSRRPLYDFIAPDGVTHTLWRLEAADSGRLAEQFRPVPLLYIADGHHRAASASRARQKLQVRAPGQSGEEPYNFFLGVLFPASQVQILPYNRTVKDLCGRTQEEFLEALQSEFSVREGNPASPRRRGEVSFYLPGRWYGLSFPDQNSAGPIASLDVTLLQEKIVAPLLGIKDVRTDKRIDFVGGIRGTQELERLVNEGRAAVAFSMYPVSVDDLIAIADANEIMPPKSTWFEPKLRDGLLIHEI